MVIARQPAAKIGEIREILRSLVKMYLLHQRDESRLGAQWIEDTSHLKHVHCFLLGSVCLLQMVQRALALAHTEIDYRQVKRRNISVQGLMLHLLNHRAGLNAV